MGKLRGNRGYSLIEVLVASGIFVTGMVTIGALVLDANTSSRQSVERTQALLLAKEGLEAVRSMRDADFDNIPAGSYGLSTSTGAWAFSGSSDTTQGQFRRTVNVSDLDSDTKKVQSAVAWKITDTRDGYVSLADYLTDWDQTHGDAADLNIDISNAAIGGASRKLVGVQIKNTASFDIAIDRMTIQWGNTNLIEQIRIDDKEVWTHNGVGTPDRRQPSGTELDIEDFKLESGEGKFDIDEIKFKGLMDGTDFIIKFIMTDGSTKYTLIDL